MSPSPSGNQSGLEALEPWLDGYLQKLKPGERMKLARKIGQLLRRRNAERIIANVEPDGSAMAPRKTGKRSRRKKGKMFPRVGLARNLRVFPGPDEVALRFNAKVAGTASVHHFGLTDAVDKRIPNSIKVRYPARKLLGIPAEDREAIMTEVFKWLESGGR